MRFPIAIVLVVAVALLSDARAEPATSATRVVLLGSGTPNPEPDRSGPAVAIVVNDTPYLVDFGPGVVRRAAAMSPSYGGEIEALETEKLGIAFLTHLHSDHSAGLPDLVLTPWVMGRDKPLELYGPKGVGDMAAHVLKAYDADIRYRVDGLEPANDQGWRVNAHEIESGLIYSDENVQVEAFRVRHGDWENAYGYRFTTPDRVIVISGDAAPDANIEAFAKGADILLHEVYSVSGFARRNEFWQKYHRNNHTSAHELGEIATRVQPRLLVLYHVLFWGSSEEVVLDEVREKYSGRVVLGRDLDVY
ncbi:MBL fold metallo-hydrolase [Gammaproteobacteria bacterium]|jgi:ribonuclease Z|nr:MBL fold metallo-hydrolase [Gammaproteobacteria bacterium]